MQQQLTLDLLEELGKSLNPQPRMANEETYYCVVGKKCKLKKLINPPPHMTSKETCYCEVCVVGTKYLKINSTPSHAWPVRKKDGYTLFFFKRSSCSWCCIRPLNSSTHSHTWPTRKLKCELCEAGKKNKPIHSLCCIYPLNSSYSVLQAGACVHHCGAQFLR